MMTTKFICHC